MNSVTVTTDTAVTEPPSLLNGGQPITRHVQEQHTVTEVVEVNNDKANSGHAALPSAAGYEFPAGGANPNTVPAEAYQQVSTIYLFIDSNRQKIVRDPHPAVDPVASFFVLQSLHSIHS